MINYTQEIDTYINRLFPICRSITGNGVRKSLQILQEIIPLQIKEYPSGMAVYDWTIPPEWNIRTGWIKNSKGEKIIDFQTHNLHVVSYSIPVHQTLSYQELLPYLHYREDLPQVIPYRTTYYKRDWGFCLSYEDFQKYFHEDDEYEVFIDSNLDENGSLSVGELLIEGKSSKEYLISCYICHPSMANDSLSGVVLTAFLAKELLQKDLNYSYRIVFVPETIGAITYCAMNEKAMKAIESGFVITTVGGQGNFGYKQSFDNQHYLNYFVEQVFKENQIEDYHTYPFDIHGSDERQYSSQGFRINTVTISKDKYYEYEYYHTSADDLNFVKPQAINNTLNLYLQLICKADENVCYKNVQPHCEIMLSKHDLYPKTGGAILPDTSSSLNELDITLWLLFYCDGELSLWQISNKLGTPYQVISKIAQKIAKKGILQF